VIGWSSLETALIVQTAILLAIMLVPLLVRERSTPTATRPQLGTVLRSLVEVFSIRSVFVMAMVMLAIHVALGVLTANAFALFTQELDWSPEAYTQLTGGWGLLAGLGGSIVGGLLADVLGRRRLVAIASIAMAAGWLVFALLSSQWTNDAFVYALAMFETACTSIMVVGLFALCMGRRVAAVGASQFTAYMSLSNFSTTLGFLLTSELPPRSTTGPATSSPRGTSSWSRRCCCGSIDRDPAHAAAPAGARIPAMGIVAVVVLASVLLTSTTYAVYRIVTR